MTTYYVDSVTGRKLANPLNKRHLSKDELERYMLIIEDEE